MPRGGKRPGAGAPKGNLNGLKHGRYSPRVRQAAEALHDDPDFLLLLEAARRRQLDRRADYARAIDIIRTNTPEVAAARIARHFPPEVARAFNLTPEEIVRRLHHYEALKRDLRQLRAMLDRIRRRRLDPPYQSLLDAPNPTIERSTT